MTDYESASASERRFLPPAVAVSAVAFALQPPAGASVPAATARPGEGDTTLWLPLVRRTRAPFAHVWALPGGPTRWDETLTDTALRSLRAAVLRGPGYLEQLYAFGSVERSANAQRLVTIAYWAMYGEADLAVPPVSDPDGAAPARDPAPVAATGAGGRWDDLAPSPGLHAASAPPVAGDEPVPGVAWFSADALPDLAFDHAEIVHTALARLRSKTGYTAVAHRFLGPTFTLGRLRTVTEAILGQRVDPANFRRQTLAQGSVIETGDVESGTPHRPAKLYRFRDPTFDHSAPRSHS